CNGLHEARGNLSVVQHWMARRPPSLPQPVVRRRLAASHGWVGAEELRAGNPRDATPHLWASLRLRVGQPTAALLLLVSLLPKGALEALRNVRRAMRRVSLRRIITLALLVCNDSELVDQLWRIVRPALLDV